MPFLISPGSPMVGPAHPMNWNAGWVMLLASLLTGAFSALMLHNENYGDGYDSFRRRIVRLGHVALGFLGIVNLLYGLSPWPLPARDEARYAGYCFVAGGISMPGVCFLSGWFAPMRHLFFIPVMLLVAGVLLVLKGAGP